jgi:hypothetical protein
MNPIVSNAQVAGDVRVGPPVVKIKASLAISATALGIGHRLGDPHLRVGGGDQEDGGDGY